MAKITRYTLTAAIGDAVPGDTIELTKEQAESPLYASRITLGGSGRSDGDSEELLAEARAAAEALVGEAEDKAAQIVSEATAKAAEIVQAAQAEAMKLATAPKK